ncbi:UNKNOWN [Stylonychia lemnae]|uniref:Uncharacterized protein n=1 Tax=Stylonychia lemnae TaxID=5949 RepID=A0A078BAK2_STYLE|nr:UNKNOWN [Stylonychia lemnae]|eukprot:CDW90287.1 UNKNOWN [Stylonychia lemnae]
MAEQIQTGAIKSNYKRLELLQNPDEFQPPYKLAYQLPDIPIKPKLFKIKIDNKKAYQYELSSVEMNQEHIINVDYNMGMNIDFIDRDIFLPFPKVHRHGKPLIHNGNNHSSETIAQTEKEQKELELMRQTYFDEKDRFILSDRNTFEIDERPQEKQERVIKLPSRYQLIDKVNKWGVDIRNPIAVRSLDEDEPENDSVFTIKGDKHKRELAVQQIQRRFEAVKHIQVGCQKGPEHPGVVATKVVDFVPFLQQMPNKVQLVICDDNIELELNKKAENNDFILRHYVDDEDENYKKYALYKFNDEVSLTQQIKESILGKRLKNSNGSLQELEKAIQLKHVRDYIYTVQNTESQMNDFLVMMPQADNNKLNTVKYIPISSKIGLQKKKRQISKSMREMILEGDMVASQQARKGKNSEYIVIAGRGYTQQEIQAINKTYDSIRCENQIDINESAVFKDKDILKDSEKHEATHLKGLFHNLNEDQEDDAGEDEDGSQGNNNHNNHHRQQEQDANDEEQQDGGIGDEDLDELF